jgi:hypothetical protein
MEKPTKYFYRILIEKLAGKPLKSQTNKRSRQHNDKNKKDKMTTNELQNTT